MSGKRAPSRAGRAGLLRAAAFGFLAVCFFALACDVKHVQVARDLAAEAGADQDSSTAPPSRDASPSDASSRDAAPTRSPDAATPARCGMSACACDDGVDNDGDGLIDGLDPECTGAFDEDEASFATGKPPKSKKCRDCFWDEDTGNGNDSCRYPSECLLGEAPSGNGSCGSCEVPQKCVDTCKARTPSGCDCFGCCEVSLRDGSKVAIELSENCSLDTIDDPEKCPRCTQSFQCRNTCGRCELCPGLTLRDLPADCRTRIPANQCEEGQPVCTTSTDCTTEQYCQLGCCFALLL
jgi:hypothetical protein